MSEIHRAERADGDFCSVLQMLEKKRFYIQMHALHYTSKCKINYNMILIKK